MHPTILTAFRDELEKISNAMPFARTPWAPTKPEVGVMQQHGPFARRRKPIPEVRSLKPNVAAGRVRNMTRALKTQKVSKGLLRVGTSLGVRAVTRGRLG